MELLSVMLEDLRDGWLTSEDFLFAVNVEKSVYPQSVGPPPRPPPDIIFGEVDCLRLLGEDEVVRPRRGDSESLRLGFLVIVEDGLLGCLTGGGEAESLLKPLRESFQLWGFVEYPESRAKLLCHLLGLSSLDRDIDSRLVTGCCRGGGAELRREIEFWRDSPVGCCGACWRGTDSRRCGPESFLDGGVRPRVAWPRSFTSSL